MHETQARKGFRWSGTEPVSGDLLDQSPQKHGIALIGASRSVLAEIFKDVVKNDQKPFYRLISISVNFVFYFQSAYIGTTKRATHQ